MTSAYPPLGTQTSIFVCAVDGLTAVSALREIRADLDGTTGDVVGRAQREHEASRHRSLLARRRVDADPGVRTGLRPAVVGEAGRLPVEPPPASASIRNMTPDGSCWIAGPARGSASRSRSRRRIASESGGDSGARVEVGELLREPEARVLEDAAFAVVDVTGDRPVPELDVAPCSLAREPVARDGVRHERGLSIGSDRRVDPVQAPVRIGR